MAKAEIVVYRVDEDEVGITVQTLIDDSEAKAVICKKAGQKWAIWAVPATAVKVPKA